MNRISLMLAFALVVFATRDGMGAVLLNSLAIQGENQIEDSDYERLIKGPADDAGTADDNILEVGDVLESILRFTQYNGLTLSDEFGSAYELTAHARVVVLGIGDSDSNSDGIFDGGDTNSDGRTNFTFGAGFGDGITAVMLYEETAKTAATQFNSNSVSPDGVGGGIDRATTTTGSGILVSTFGFDLTKTSDFDFWFALDALNDISVFRSQNVSQGGDFFFGLSMLTNPGGLSLVEDAIQSSATSTYHDIVGNGTLKSPSGLVDLGWDAQTDTTVLYVAVPEPATMIIWPALACCFGVFGAFGRNKASSVCRTE